MINDVKDTTTLRYSICVSGAAAGSTVQQSHLLAERIGTEIAMQGHVVTTGATVGLPYYAAHGARKVGGMSIGFSPANTVIEHMRKYRLPHDVFDFINFTGLNYVGRDLYLVQSSDAVITVGGRIGSLHEFTSALEARKPCGVLLGSGGAADAIPEILKLQPEFLDLVVFDDNPEQLVRKIVAILDVKYAELQADLLKYDPHWYMNREAAKAPPPRAG